MLIYALNKDKDRSRVAEPAFLAGAGAGAEKITRFSAAPAPTLQK